MTGGVSNKLTSGHNSVNPQIANPTLKIFNDFILNTSPDISHPQAFGVGSIANKQALSSIFTLFNESARGTVTSFI
jgi:hypothetical protein